MKVFSDGRVKAWVDGVELEEGALEQIKGVARMPFIHKHVAVMPDAHGGIGCTVGTVLATTGAIIPAAVGVDLGCGMVALKTDWTARTLPDNLSDMRSAIEKATPHGRTDNGGANDRGAWGRVPDKVAESFKALYGRTPAWAEKYPKTVHTRAVNQLGTLGTGNHFIEVCLDLEGYVWVMLHSGSRGQGASIGQFFIEKAKREMEKWFVSLPNVDLAYLAEGSEYFQDYIQAVSWAQEYARVNRELMLRATLGAMERTVGRAITPREHAVNCHHNYISKEYHFGKSCWVTRKGAVSAREGQLGIIPGSMGARSFIVRGKGNPESFTSCSHGAGRRMSRTQARKQFTVEDHETATCGVECRKDAGVIDETPAAYKSIEDVMNAQKDLVEVVAELKQVLCVKG